MDRIARHLMRNQLEYIEQKCIALLNERLYHEFVKKGGNSTPCSSSWPWLAKARAWCRVTRRKERLAARAQADQRPFS